MQVKAADKVTPAVVRCNLPSTSYLHRTLHYTPIRPPERSTRWFRAAQTPPRGSCGKRAAQARSGSGHAIQGCTCQQPYPAQLCPPRSLCDHTHE